MLRTIRCATDCTSEKRTMLRVEPSRTSHRFCLLATLLLCLVATRTFAAPIFSNLGESVVVDDPPTTIEFWSREPFRYAAFWAETFDGQPIMSNQWDPFESSIDGVFYRVRWTPWAHEDKAIQVDADSHDFAGIGRLIDYTQPPIPGAWEEPVLPPPGDPGEEGLIDPAAVDETPLVVLLGVGLVIWTLRRVA
jgi:hypothetical protein